MAIVESDTVAACQGPVAVLLHTPQVEQPVTELLLRVQGGFMTSILSSLVLCPSSFTVSPQARVGLPDQFVQSLQTTVNHSKSSTGQYNV